MIKKSQTALEFVITSVFLLTIFLMILLIMNNNVSENIREKQNTELKKVAITIQNEIALCSRASSGYQREFEIPDKIGNLDYNIYLVDGLVYINSTHYSIALPIEKVEGSIFKGNNVIRKINKQIKLNSNFDIRSDFMDDEKIPTELTCYGSDRSPYLEIINPPNNTNNFAMVIEDTGISGSLSLMHLIVWNISNQTVTIPKNTLPLGTLNGTNDFGDTNYFSICPPPGESHLYQIKLYSLNSSLDLVKGDSKEEFFEEIEDKVIEETDLAGYYV